MSLFIRVNTVGYPQMTKVNFNPPKFPERFHTFMPEGGKKADLMFVQNGYAY